ncbi:MAG: PEP-CTERM sorting domain-containing protein, partial [Candidatus Binatia bacterium]
LSLFTQCRPNGGTTSTQTWAQLGAISNTLTAAGGFPIPEPGTASLFSFGLLALALRVRGGPRPR